MIVIIVSIIIVIIITTISVRMIMIVIITITIVGSSSCADVVLIMFSPRSLRIERELEYRIPRFALSRKLQEVSGDVGRFLQE